MLLRSALARVATASLLLAACDRPSAPPPAPSASAGAAAVAAPAESGPARASSAGPAAPAPATGPSRLALTLVGPGELEVSAMEAGARAALRGRVEARTPDGFAPVALDPPYRLHSSCEAAAGPACVEVLPGLPIVAAAFAARPCLRQCAPGCRSAPPPAAGTYRFVVEGCEGEATGERASPTFDLPADEHSPERLWAADGLTKASALRLDVPKARLAGPDAAGPEQGMTHLFGRVRRPGTERTLDAAARDALASFLRDPKGFDDAVLRRCAPGRLVGFALERTLPTTGREPRAQHIELAVDLGCRSLMIARGDGAPRLVHATYFDPSRAALVALVKSVFAGDREIDALR